jgi:hypothetical protein
MARDLSLTNAKRQASATRKRKAVPQSAELSRFAHDRTARLERRNRPTQVITDVETPQ